MQVALQPPALVVVRGDDCGPRQAQPVKLRAQESLEPLVVEGQPGGVLERVDELRIV